MTKSFRLRSKPALELAVARFHAASRLRPCAGFGQRQIFPKQWAGFSYTITRHNGRLIAHHLKAVTKSFCLRSKPAIELAVARFHFATKLHPCAGFEQRQIFPEQWMGVKFS